MKPFIPLICSLLLIGCSETPSTQTPPAASNETQTAAPSPAETVQTPVSSTQTSVPSAPGEETQAVTTVLDGSALFGQKCASCHGSKAEKSALGKSLVIAGWDEQQIHNALKGYQAGTYGKEMKGIMQGQAKALSDDQITALAKHISGL